MLVFFFVMLVFFFVMLVFSFVILESRRSTKDKHKADRRES